jgi:gas vesicle protein
MARRKKKNPYISMLIGGVIGGAAALIMAPASGRETRNSISTGANRILYRANEQKNMIIRDSRRFADDILRKAEGVYNRSVGYAEGTFSSSADAIDLQIRSFKNAVDAAIDAYRNTSSARPSRRKRTGLEDEVVVNEMFTDFEDETLPKQEGMGRRQE